MKTSQFALLCEYLLLNTKDKRMDIRKVSKYCFFSDLLSSGTLGVPITEEKYVAELMGPVLQNFDSLVDNLLSSERFKKIDGHLVLVGDVNDFDINLDPRFKNTVSLVIAEFGAKSFEVLSEISHQTPAWTGTEIGQVISDKLMALPYLYEPVQGINH